ncbi:DUF6348 family protein [Paracidovorax avenae]|uniref:DUF6348 family protein n=1 Tax=Paracidovorax avenae TaxID=80867 RepID=UPI0006B3A91F|nr:DUF6348 family protein [Paracidovorax avenae]
MKYRVIKPHRSEYPEPICLLKDEEVRIGERYEGPEGWDEWYFCATAVHPGGWVPGQVIEQLERGCGKLLEDYSARELDVDEGEVLTGSRMLNGWLWCESSNSSSPGWVPLANLELLDGDASGDDAELPMRLLVDLFAAHGLQGPVHRGWLLPGERLPCVTAVWTRRDSRMGILSIHLHFLEGPDLVEAFTGLGETDGEGIRNGFAAFIEGGLHAVLGAIWERPGLHPRPQQWRIGKQDCEVFAGPWQARGGRLHACGLDAAIRAAIEVQPLESDLHWFRFFVAHFNGQTTLEALKDNQPWPEGLSVLQSRKWEFPQGYGSLRRFMAVRQRG